MYDTLGMFSVCIYSWSLKHFCIFIYFISFMQYRQHICDDSKGQRSDKQVYKLKLSGSLQIKTYGSLQIKIFKNIFINVNGKDKQAR